METEYTLEELTSLAQEKIDLGAKLLADLAKQDTVDGVRKISKKISQELKFLNKVKNAKTVSINHILCSNLTHFACLVQCLLSCQDVTYVEAAEANPHMFKPPRVFFRFLSKIDDEPVFELERIGVTVLVLQTSQPVPRTEPTAVTKLNLDITTLIAYVSAMTNGSANWEYNEPLLTEQARWEREKPIKPVLDALFQEKELICCETAVSSFNEILSILGGPKEKARAEELFRRVTVLPDVPLPSEMSNIRVGGKIKPRSLQIFAFGLQHEAITVTSNEGFVRAAKMQGLEVPVCVHDARALTEEKEQSARLLEE